MDPKHPELAFLDYIITAITGDTGCFELRRSVDEKGVFLQVFIDDEHMGKIIGRDGNVANSIRTLLYALGHRHDAFYSLKIEKREGGAQRVSSF